MKRTISVLLLAAVLMTVSCGETQTDAKDTTTSGDNTNTSAPETETYLSGLDFDGRKITLFCTDYEATCAFDNMYVESEIGDVVNDSIYEKNKYVEELLNVTLDFIEHDFNYGDKDVMYNSVRTSVMSDSEPYNITLIPTYFTSTLIAEGIMADLNEMPYLDMSKEWWSQGYRQNAEIDGKIYMAAGDGVLPFITGFFGIAVNKDLAKENGIEDVYSVVNDGKWTIDKMYDMSKRIYRDLNGNGEYDDKDQYGLEALHANFIIPFLIAGAGEVFTRNGDSFDYSFGSERVIDIYSKVFTMLHDKESTLKISKNVENDIRSDSAFVEGRVLFTLINLNDTMYFRETPFEYGILPYPKFDEAQKSYRTMSSNGLVTFSVPVTSEGDEAVGAVIEAMGYAGNKYTTPAYFETALKIKYAHDDETAQMLDLMKNSEYTSVAGMFAASIEQPENDWGFTLWDAKKDGTWASAAEKKKDKIMTKLETFIETVKNSAE